jgi:hypothetical protein
MKKLGFAVLFMVLGAGLMYFYYNNLSIDIKFGKSSVTPPIPSQSEQIITPTTPIANLPSEIPQISDVDLLRTAFASKYNKSFADTEVTVSKKTGTYASGGVNFTGEVGGGWFLAYKQAGNWIIVANGNGTIQCASIAPYNFPVDIVPECWDEATSKLIVR